MNRLKSILLSTLLFAGSVVSLAQNYWFKHIGLNDGLSSSQINSICKDSKGFVWFGTSAGLNRFDGSSIRQFQSNYQMASALPDSYIHSVQEGYDGMLWVKTNGGYVVMDPISQTFDRSVAQRLSMLAANIDPEIVFFDEDKNLWVFDKGKAIYFYKAKQQLVYTLSFTDPRTGLKEGETVSAFCNSRDGVLAVFTNGRVACLDGEQQKVVWSNDVIAKNTAQEEEYEVFCDTLNNIWVYGEGHSYFYEKAQKRWYRSLSELAAEWAGGVSFGNEIVTGVTADHLGNVWVSTDRGGLLLMRPTERTLLARIQAGGLRGLPSSTLQTVYVDDTNLLWIGSLRNGVSYYAPNLFMFDVDNLGDVNGIAEDSRGRMWYATRSNGLICKAPDAEPAYFTTANGLNDNTLSCVLAASDGTVWAGSNRFGLNRISEGGTSVYTSVSGNKEGLLDNNIQALAEDRFGNIWIGTRKGGLQCLNTKTGRYTNFSVQNGKLLSDNVTSLSARGTQIVAGTTNGIMLLNLSSNQAVTYTGTSAGDKHFSSNVVTQVCLDSRGLIWVGTRDGLNMLDTQIDQLSTFTMQDGLPSNVIYGIAEDKNHDIWVTTAHGVARIAVQNISQDNSRFAFNFFAYGVGDGLQGIEFNMGAIMATRTGRIVMGGQNGINWMRDIQSKQRQRQLHVLLSRLIIDDQPIEVGVSYGGRVILNRVLHATPSIKLRDSDNQVCITLGIDDYNHAEHARFMYQLEGRSEAWLPVTGDGYTLRLNDLGSGSYKLHVKAMLDDGKTVSEEAVIGIVVQKPWYLRWWFFVVVVLAICGLCYLLYRLMPFVRSYYSERRKEILALRKRQLEIETVAQDLRTNVVGMIPQLGLLQMEATNPEHKEVLNGLHHSAREMLSSLNQLKDNQTLRVSDRGIDTGMEDVPVTDDILIGDDGPVSTVPGEGEFLVSDDGIISASGGLAVKSPLLKYTIFVVEPDKDMLEFVHDCLKNTYQIVSFTDAEACWTAMADNRPSLVMCAEGMPGLTGSQLCERIKNERSYERIPFILTTDGILTQGELTLKHITLMADDYVPSPYNLQSVVVRINKLLGEPNEDVVVDDTLRGAEAMTSSVNAQLRLLLDQYVKQNINRKELSIEEMSQVMGISRTLLFRKVERVTGLPPSDYIRSVRLVEAAKLLESGFVSPAEVAQELGFGNLASFSRFFQAEYGKLPSQYAEDARKGLR